MILEGTDFDHTLVGKIDMDFKIGDLAAVHCIVDSCGHCGSCEVDLEQFCDVGAAFSFNSVNKEIGVVTVGGVFKHL